MKHSDTSPRAATLAALLAALLASCASSGVSNPHSRILDGGLVSQEPCGPPCFWGFTPGYTSFDNARATLQDAGVHCEEDDSDEEVSLSCLLAGEGYMRGLGWIYVGRDQTNGTVSRVGFGPSLEVNASDIVALYGPPDSLFIYSEGTPEHPLVDASLVFNDISMILALPYEEGFSFALDPDDDVVTVHYYDSKEFSAETALMERYIQPWKGYGKYEP